MERYTKLIKGKGRVLVVPLATVAFLLATAILTHAFTYQDLRKAIDDCYSATHKISDEADSLRLLSPHLKKIIDTQEKGHKNSSEKNPKGYKKTAVIFYPKMMKIYEKQVKTMQRQSKRTNSKCNKALKMMKKGLKLD